MADGKEELQNELYFTEGLSLKSQPRRLTEEEKQKKKNKIFKKAPTTRKEKAEDYLDRREQLEED